jgi:UDP-N-acetylglucosamine:LPS N-acetylglucosamine transferase
VDYVLEHETGTFCETPEEAKRTVEMWLADQANKLMEISQNAEKIGRPETAGQIAKKAWDLIN